jgi:hypothetical protein
MQLTTEPTARSEYGFAILGPVVTDVDGNSDDPGLS